MGALKAAYQNELVYYFKIILKSIIYLGDLIMNFKSKNFRRFLFYLGVVMFITSLYLIGKVPYMPALAIAGLVVMCAYPVNKIKRHKIK